MFHEIPENQSDFEILQNGNSAKFSYALAECAQTNRLLNVVSNLSYGFDAAIPTKFFHELAFEIEIISLNGEMESFSTQNRNIAANFIPATARSRVIHLAATGYARLIELIQPNVIYRVTKTPISIAKALPKHNILTHRIEALGYAVVETGTDRHNRGFWLMERQIGSGRLVDSKPQWAETLPEESRQ